MSDLMALGLATTPWVRNADPKGTPLKMYVDKTILTSTLTLIQKNLADAQNEQVLQESGGGGGGRGRP